MELDHFSAKENDLIKKSPPPPTKTAEPTHPLQEVAQVLGNRAFGALVSDAVKRFQFWYFNRTNAPVPDTIWEAYANCFTACSGAKIWDPATIGLAGRTREFRRNFVGERSEANLQRDVDNQAVGRSFALRQLECDEASRAAAVTPGALDLSAPVRHYWTPSDGVYAAPVSRAGSRLPATTASPRKRQD
jgi:hypothetical protein